MPRATTAAWLVMPPRVVTMPSAACMPWMSSGEVSTRTRIALRPACRSASASSAENTISPLAAPGEAGRPIAIGSRLTLRVDRRMQQLVERGRLDARDRLLPRDQALVGHLDRDAQRGARGALAVAGLQHPELAALDGELHVLHVAVVLLQQLRRRDELLEHLRHDRFERRPIGAGRLARGLGDVLRRANAGDDVLALRVDQELAVKLLRAGRRVAGEGDAGRATSRPCCRTPSPAR